MRPLIHCSGCRGGEQDGPWTREGAGRGAGLCGVPALRSSSKELEGHHSLLQRAGGALLLHLQRGLPQLGGQTTPPCPQLTQPHCASKASPSPAGLGTGVCAALSTGCPRGTHPPSPLFLPTVSPTSPSTPANLVGLKIIKQSVQFCSYKDMSLPFQSNSKTFYLRAPVLPLRSLLITIPGCLPGFMLSPVCTAHFSGQKIHFIV